MHELHRVLLENEMDLILAYKRSMKLGELTGLSLSAQTTFATAVSELSRWGLEKSKKSCLVLSVDNSLRTNYLVACINDNDPKVETRNEGLEYAKKLVSKYLISKKGDQTTIELFYGIPSTVKIDLLKVDEWRISFRNERPISPYEELKLKNEQLRELSEKIQQREQQYKILTNSLPQIIFSLDDAGQVTYANEWLEVFTGKTLSTLNQGGWNEVIHPDDYDAFSILFSRDFPSAGLPLKIQCRIKNASSDEYIWHIVSITPLGDEKREVSSWIGYMVDIHAQKIIEQTLLDNHELTQAQERLQRQQQELEETIRQLNRSNQELQQFAYIASHDLQEPVRKVLYYCDYLLQQSHEMPTSQGQQYLSKIQAAAIRMRHLILDLLRFSQLSNGELSFTAVSLENVAQHAVQSLQMLVDEKKGTVNIHSLPIVTGEKGLLEQLFENIISNALKYSRSGVPPVIDIYARQRDSLLEIVFEDNGIGFDEKFTSKMFELFQRLHSRNEYEGNGIGLAICKKIAALHNGSIEATSRSEYGACFTLTIPNASINA